MICLWLGLSVAVGIVTAIPLFTDATQNRLLQGELTESGTFRPPFAFMWRYVGAWNGNIDREAYDQADRFLTTQAADEIGLPAEAIVRHITSDKLRLFAASGGGFDDGTPLLWSNLGFISGLAEQVRIIEGTVPESGSASGDLPVLLSQTLADQLGAGVGERFLLFGSGSGGDGISVEVVAIWAPLDPADGVWFYGPESFDEMLLTVDETAFWAALEAQAEEPVALALWYLILDGRRVRPATVNRLLEQVRTVDSRVNALLNNTELAVSPVASLENYDGSAGLLSLNLLIFSVPILGLILYFVTLIAGMVVRQGESEIAILHSRGQTRTQILLVYLIQGVVLCLAALVAGLFLGGWLAEVMGRTTTFLDVGWLSDFERQGLGVVLTPEAIRYGAIAALIGLPALLLPALRSSRHTIITLRNRQARAEAGSRPLWQRLFLDILLLGLALYGWYQLEEQGGIGPFGPVVTQGDPFSNPLLFLVPVLFCFGLGLLAIRLFPWVINRLAALAAWQPSMVLLITLRQLGRSTAHYSGSLLFLTLTLSLAIFSASMALTLDNHLEDQVYYQIGADLNLAELGENTEPPRRPQQPGQQQRPTPTPVPDNEKEAEWLFLPVEEHLEVDGVTHAARVGDYEATASLSGRQQQGRILGVDRIDFASVAYFRPDFAGNESLGGVLNRLAVGRNYILVNRSFMERNGLAVGDPLRLNVEAADNFTNIDFVIAGPLDLFPTLYPQDGPFFVAHLDYLHENMGGQYPYDVWLRLAEGADSGEVVQGVRDLGLIVVSASSAPDRVQEEAVQPERQGLFGLLSVGFGAAALLTVLGFLLFSIVSFRQRLIQLGMLRAIGLSVGQMIGYLSLEQAIIILTGMGLGTGLGVWAATLFIPFFQVGDNKTAGIPPFVVEVAWDQIVTICLLFVAMFLVAVIILVALLLRMKLFEAVKLGETV